MTDPKVDALIAKLYPDLCDHLLPESEQCLSCEIDAATAAVQRVRELHQPVKLMFSGVTTMGNTIHEWRKVCTVCDRWSGALYPCATIKALDGEKV
jgi:hypothetical protein